MDTEFWFENLKKRDRLEDQDVVGRIILQWIFKKVSLVYLTQNSTYWYAFVKVVMNCCFIPTRAHIYTSKH
jgi:hypothetical protein